MTGIAIFEPATPAMIVGQSFDDSLPPLGLSEPFALLGGDRLGTDGIPFRIMHEHQPTFRRWVTQSCQASLSAERPWFRGTPLLLSGPKGAGRTHAARWLARVAGVPHAVLNLSDPVIAANIAASGRVNEALWASPVTVAMAAARCANPVASVIGADQASDDVKAGLVAMIHPDTASSWSEDQLNTAVDLGEVTWIIQCEQLASLPAALRSLATSVVLQRPPTRIDSVYTLSIMLEVMGDLGIDPTDPAFGWSRIRSQLPRQNYATAKVLYAQIFSAINNLKHGSPIEADDGEADDEYVPF